MKIQVLRISESQGLCTTPCHTDKEIAFEGNEGPSFHNQLAACQDWTLGPWSAHDSSGLLGSQGELFPVCIPASTSIADIELSVCCVLPTAPGTGQGRAQTRSRFL